MDTMEYLQRNFTNLTDDEIIRLCTNSDDALLRGFAELVDLIHSDLKQAETDATDYRNSLESAELEIDSLQQDCDGYEADIKDLRIQKATLQEQYDALAAKYIKNTYEEIN